MGSKKSKKIIKKIDKKKKKKEYESEEEKYQSSEESDQSQSDQEGGDDDEDHLDNDPDDELQEGVEDQDEEVDPIDDAPDPTDEISEGEGEDVQAEDVEVQDEDFEDVSKACHMKGVKKKDFIALDDDDSNYYARLEPTRIPDSQRTSDREMTKYEMVRIIGTRAQQISMGAKPLIDNVENLHPAKVAYLELKLGLTPIIIRRRLPNKKYEEWKISELEIIHEIKDPYYVPENYDKILINELKKQNKVR